MSESQQDFGQRVKGALVVKPIVFGNTARYLGKVREADNHTHQWTVYLRSYSNEDMSTYIKKVIFRLHDSYVNFNRIVTKPPYEVSETGWGEFEVIIKIHFVDPAERPVTIYHMLKLFKPGNPHPIITNYLLSEFYDELVFAEPSTMLYELLQSAPPLPPEFTINHETDFEEKREKTLEIINSAKKQMSEEIDYLREKINLVKEGILKYKAVIATKNSSPTKEA